jgi:OFA family oxalate/formate antiporter-like MFS transporter
MTQQVASGARRVVSRWLQLTACVIAMMAIANLQYAWTLFTIPLTESLKATLSAVQLAFTFFILAETWLVPVEGYLIDKLGARIVVTVGGVLVGAGWIGSGFAQSLAGLYVWYTVGGVGAGAVYGASIGSALKWFPDRRGLAAGLTAGAYGVGTALTILPIQSMIESSGYRSAFVVWGAIQGVIVLAAAQFMLAPPAGWRPAGWATPSAGTSSVAQSQVSSTPWQMVQTASFWVMYVMMAMVAFGGLMVTAQLKPIAAIYGMDKTIVWFGVTALGLALVLDRILNGLTRPFWGWVSDHIGRYNTMAITFFLEAVAIFLLLQVIDRPVWFVILSGFVFFAWGNIYSLFPAAIGDLFGPKYATTNYGLQYTAKGTASIFAGVGAAWLVEVTGSWTPVFWAAIACDLVAAGLALFWLRPLVTRITSWHAEPGKGEVRTAAVVS